MNLYVRLPLTLVLLLPLSSCGIFEKVLPFEGCNVIGGTPRQFSLNTYKIVSPADVTITYSLGSTDTLCADAFKQSAKVLNVTANGKLAASLPLNSDTLVAQWHVDGAALGLPTGTHQVKVNVTIDVTSSASKGSFPVVPKRAQDEYLEITVK